MILMGSKRTYTTQYKFLTFKNLSVQQSALEKRKAYIIQELKISAAETAQGRTQCTDAAILRTVIVPFFFLYYAVKIDGEKRKGKGAEVGWRQKRQKENIVSGTCF